MATYDVVESLKAKTLIFCVTPGRSGTRLLCRLLSDCVKIHAEHEPHPRVNFVMRTILAVPQAAGAWLVTEKLPAMLAATSAPIYAETSHLICKGLVEPILQLGLRPKFIHLARPATEVAQSLFQLNVIPGRTPDGKLTLVGPEDPGVLALAESSAFSDYQLCFWYAREIERRQAFYGALFRKVGCAQLSIEMQRLTEWDSVIALGQWVLGDAAEPDADAFEAIRKHNQNPRKGVAGGKPLREIPADFASQERDLNDALKSAKVTPR